MHRGFLAFCAASLLSTTLPLAAQSSRTPVQYDEKETTISGCLEKNKSGGFWLTSAAIESAGSKSDATPTGTSGDKDVKRATANGLWNLENGKDLDRFLNQRIEVTGRAKKDTSGDELKGTTGHEMQARDFDVKSVTRLAESCK